MSVQLTRRAILASALRAGASVAIAGAGVVLGPSVLGRDGGSMRPRLVVLIARGGMDGLALAPPLGDPNLTRLRQGLTVDPAVMHPLTADFGLHPRLTALGRLAAQGRVRIAPAAASPTRDRSHFRAQDLLETGTGSATEETGWLRRAAERLFPGGVAAMGVGGSPPVVLQGSSPTQSWSADLAPVDRDTQRSLAALYADDPLLGAVSRIGLLGDLAGDAPPPGVTGSPAERTARVAARLLAAEHGASIAVLSLYGFDTHFAQGGAAGPLADSFGEMDRAIAELQSGLGLAWSATAVLILTEFGRTVAMNGVGGTDHGTAFAALLTGGATRPGGLIGDWPGLAPAALFEGRDLRPALDLRALLKGVLMEQFGLDRATLGSHVFPGSLDVAPVRGLVQPVLAPYVRSVTA